MSRVAVLFAALALAIPAGLIAQEPTEQKKIKRNPDVINIEEIEAAGSEIQNAYELVQRLRPLWMRKVRGPASVHLPTAEVVVYVSGMRRGPLESLREFPVSSLREVRRLAGIDATQRFGPDHESGAILVTLR